MRLVQVCVKPQPGFNCKCNTHSLRVIDYECKLNLKEGMKSCKRIILTYRARSERRYDSMCWCWDEVGQVAQQMGRSPSTLSRELGRNRTSRCVVLGVLIDKTAARMYHALVTTLGALP